MWITNRRSAAALASLALLVPAGRASAGEPCVWNGTAPRCDGDCEPGYTLVTRDRRGPRRRQEVHHRDQGALLPHLVRGSTAGVFLN